jgi:hypothetical protein
MLRREMQPSFYGLGGQPLFVLGVVALLLAIGLSRIVPVDQSKLRPQDESPPPPKRPDRFVPEQPVEPFKSLVLDAAQAYLATGRLPVVTSAPLAKPSAPGEKP